MSAGKVDERFELNVRLWDWKTDTLEHEEVVG